MSDKYESIIIDGIEYLSIREEYKNKIEKDKFKYLLSLSGIPLEYHNLDFSNYEGDRSLNNLNNCKKYALSCQHEKFQNINLFLTGTYGTQKTTIACTIGKGFMKSGYKVKFVYASELIDYLMKNQGFGYVEEIDKKIEIYMQCDLLIIDDFGKGTYWKNNPSLIIEAWDKFLRRIISENKRIVMTSNFSLDYLKNKYGESLFMLLHRNFKEFIFYDSVHSIARERFDDLWS